MVPITHKTCTLCKKEKPVADFHKDKTRPDGYNNCCKECGSNKRRLWRKENKEKWTEHNRRWWIKNKYGITYEEFEQILEEQNGECKICHEPLDIKSRHAHVDHDHNTGKVRGILCSKCNSGLGMFRDNPEFLSSAIKYLAA